MIRPWLLICFLMLIPDLSSSELNGKQENTLRKASNACSKMTSKEQEVVYLCNIARSDGALFIEKYLAPFVEEHKLQSAAVRSLFKDLKNTKNIPPLQGHCSLYEVANAHAVKMGKTGRTGHENYKQRFKSVKDEFNQTAENCDYGSNDPLEIVMSLLIDEGVPSRAHRKYILSEDYSHVGVSIQPHKTYDFNAVMAFGGR